MKKNSGSRETTKKNRNANCEGDSRSYVVVSVVLSGLPGVVVFLEIA